ITINGKSHGQLQLNDYIDAVVDDPLSMTICFDDVCNNYSFTNRKINYIECSYSSKTDKIETTIMPTNEGEFYLKNINFHKAKRK
ncbi:hypothetical protein, partial [Fulvivirga aurantia]|uniref:hypothetical protein n=1 Tax=Fulvivirga aurantia TaxID=2529383 RepID=UPI001CA3ED08